MYPTLYRSTIPIVRKMAAIANWEIERTFIRFFPNIFIPLLCFENVLIRKAWTYHRNILCSLCKIRLRNKTACSCDESMYLYDPLANFCHSHMNNYAKRFSANQIYKERSYGEKLPAFFLILRLYNLANFLCNLLNKDIMKIQQSHSQLFLTLYFICLTRHAWETRSKVNANIFS